MAGKRGRRTQSDHEAPTRRRVIRGGAAAAVALAGAATASRFFSGPPGQGRVRGPGGPLDFLTPTDQFFRFSNGPRPQEISSSQASLSLGDGVRLPWSQVTRWATQEVVRTLQCDGNGYEGQSRVRLGCQAVPDYDEDPERPEPENWTWRFGGIGNARWNTLSVRELFARAGASTEGGWLRATGRDDYIRYFPREVALEPDFLVAIGMNGQPLPHVHGAPGRLLVPDQYGAMNIKWVHDLSFGTMDDTRNFDGGSPNHYPIKPLAFATQPVEQEVLPAGTIELNGAAFAGARPVKEVLLWSGPETRWKAVLVDRPEANVWTRWKSTIQLSPGSYELKICCVDSWGAHSQFVSPYGDAEGYGGIHVLRLKIS